MNSRADLGSTLRRQVDLSHWTTMQVGGPAEFLAEPVTESELLEAIDFAGRMRVPWIIIGKGSNMLFSDEGYSGVCISLHRYDADRIEIDPERKTVTASGGVLLSKLVLKCRDAGFSAPEFLANIPGTLGGALVMNAGFSRFPGQRNEIGDLVEEVLVLTPSGAKEIFKREELGFSYRQSSLEGRIILSGTLKIWKRNPSLIQREIQENFRYRNKVQDLNFPSSGSIFRNPSFPNPSAGYLIEQVGLKGTRVGGAMVSNKHGNYIVNIDHATSSDIIQLIEKIQKVVFDETGIILEIEIRIVKRS